MKKLSLLLILAAAGVLAAAAPAGTGATPTLVAKSSQFGRIVWDGRNRALYAFTADSRGRSACSGACAAAWPPYIAKGKLKAGAGVKQSLLGTIKRADGRRQVTYRGRPLYYYAHDPVGRVLCQNIDEFGGLWLVVRPTGALVR
jgi:predicted lipoprotein with Yx(FWY)xxD motif